MIKHHSYKNKDVFLSEEYKTNFQKINDFLEILKKFQNDNKYITWLERDQIKNSFKSQYKYLNKKVFNEIPLIKKFIHEYLNLENIIRNINNSFVNNEIERSTIFFSNICGKSLDMQQRKVIVVDEYSNLCIAGAGSGKTLTVVGKVKYLIEKRKIRPEEILLLSYTRKSVNELQERISKCISAKIKVSTFHELGLSIIQKQEPIKFAIADPENDTYKAVKNYVHNISNFPDCALAFLEFQGCYSQVLKDQTEFGSIGEYFEYILKDQTRRFATLRGYIDESNNVKIVEDYGISENKITYQGERVKSIDEVLIANFLFLHGIKYEYEKIYPYGRLENKKSYKPDFYLIDYDVWLEHFGVNKDKRAPQFGLGSIEEKKYLDDMEWKCHFHQKHNTKLIKTYSYFTKMDLNKKLEELLLKNNIKFKKINPITILNMIKQNDMFSNELIKLICTCIHLAKSNRMTNIQIVEKMKKYNQNNVYDLSRSSLFLRFFLPILEYYETWLNINGKIDFDDMINKAIEIINQKQISFPYKYIIIDEYQDISMSRFHLISKIREKAHAKLLCVGDDWQSIYRFAGSDLDLFCSFQTYVGEHSLLLIEKTYRNSQELINISSKFVMSNPSQQKKTLKSNKSLQNPIEIILMNNVRDSIIFAIQKIAKEKGTNTNILILGRNNFDINVLLSDKNMDDEFTICTDNKITYNKFKNINLKFLTVHKAKGIEADNVVIINVENNIHGFPNKLQDDPILSIFLAKPDEYDFAEERRLFYVALTRTKNKTYLCATFDNPSLFIKELIQNNNILVMTNQEHNLEKIHCPCCKTGYLIARKDKKGREFLGCTNYPQCDKTFDQIDIHKNPRCPNCGGYMIKKKGHHNEFYACSNYPTCKETIPINYRQ